MTPRFYPYTSIEPSLFGSDYGSTDTHTYFVLDNIILYLTRDFFKPSSNSDVGELIVFYLALTIKQYYSVIQRGHTLTLCPGAVQG